MLQHSVRKCQLSSYKLCSNRWKYNCFTYWLLVGNLLLLLKERVLASRKSVSTSKENSFYRWKYTFPRMITQPVIIGHQDIPRTPSSAFVKDLIWSSFPYLTFQGRFKPTYQENILKTFSEFILVELQMVP